MAAIEISKPVSKSVYDLLSESQAADLLSISPGTLSVWRSTGRYALPYVKIGARVRYRRSDLQSWIDSRLHATGASK